MNLNLNSILRYLTLVAGVDSSLIKINLQDHSWFNTMNRIIEFLSTMMSFLVWSTTRKVTELMIVSAKRFSTKTSTTKIVLPAITKTETETTQCEPAKPNRLQPLNNLEELTALCPDAEKRPFSTSSDSSNTTNKFYKVLQMQILLNDTRKSICGLLIKVYGNSVQLSTRKQNCISLSTMEAEYITSSICISEALRIRNVLASINLRDNQLSKIFILILEFLVSYKK